MAPRVSSGTVILLALATASIVVAATLFSLCLPARGSLSFLLGVALIAQGMVVVTMGVAGIILGTLSGAVLTVGAAIWLAVSIVTTRRIRPTTPWRTRLDGAIATVRPVLAYPPVAIAALLVAGAFAWRVILALRLPMIDYDGWSYHLIFGDVWLQHDRLVLVLQRPWTAGYPGVIELMTTWLMAFSRSDALAGLTSVVPIPVVIVATAGLARSLGADRRQSLLAGLLMAMTPAVLALAGTSYIDAASVAAVVATWWLGVRVLGGERGASTALLLGIAGGLALGSKGTNVLLVAPILGVAGLFLLRDALVGENLRGLARRLAPVVALSAPVVLIGLSWYVKNILVFGNPLYPFSMGPLPGVTTLADFSLSPPELEGQGTVQQLVTSWTADWHLTRYAYNIRPGGLGRAWPLELAVAVVGAGLLVRRRRWGALGLVVAPAVVTLLVMPMPWYARLTLFLPGVALPLAGVAASSVRNRSVAAVGGVALVGIAAISMVLATVLPNVSLRPALSGTASPLQYLRFILVGSDAERANISLRGECAGFAVIPPGSRVAPGGFNLLHGAIGPDLDRILTDPLGQVSSPDALAAAMRTQGATWLATRGSGDLARYAAAAPDRFIDHGAMCQDGHLWELRPGG